jgi:FkbM family methyltransferase
MENGVIQVSDFAQEQKTSYCIDLETRDRQVLEGCHRIRERLVITPDHDGHIAVVCYGPSLEATWEQLRSFDKIITCSGAHKFLIDKGIIPTWHAEVDPRPHKADLIGTPHKDVEYLVASVCHQAVFDLLEGYNVKLWHVFSHESGRDIPMAFPRGEWAITGGSNVGLRCMVLARFLGFSKMTIFGMDYSFKNDGTQHAGWHPKEAARVHAVYVGDEVFYTNPAMHKYAQEFFDEITKLGNVEIEVIGNGLLQSQIKERMKQGPIIPKTDKLAPLAATLPPVISPEYLELNKRLHVENPDYGISGSKRAEVVRNLVESVKPASVLDYGCGKSTLAMALPFPIWEYDPAIPGKDAPPRPADLVICTDVMEHVEKEFLEAVLLDLARCTLKVCYLVVNTAPARKTLADGRNAHLIQKPLEWWQEMLSRYFEVAKIETAGVEVTAILGPKKKETPPPPKTAPPLDFSNRVTPVRYKKTEIKFKTPNSTTEWRAKSLITKEPATIAWIDTFLPGDVMFDVGANVGGYTVFAAKHKGVKVYAFEPEAENYSLLVQNIALNDLNAKAYCLAICEKEKLDTLHLGERMAGAACHTFGLAIDPHGNSRNGNHPEQAAIGMSIDSLVARGLPQPDHIKIDVDGLESKVIEGALRTLEKVKSVLVEINPALPAHVALIDELQNRGFTFDPAQVEAATRKDGTFKGVAEYVFVRKVSDHILNHLSKAIANAQVVHDPFPHLYIKDALPEDAFQLLIDPSREYTPIEQSRNVKGYPQRFTAQCPLTLPGLKQILCDKFGVSGDFTDETLLIRDLPGYKIGPHTDSPVKVISALFYLNGQEGTSLYTPKNKEFRCKGGPHYSFDEFEKVGTMQFTPNSMFAFLKTDNSFHGVEPTSHQRDVMLFDVRRKKQTT